MGPNPLITPARIEPDHPRAGIWALLIAGAIVLLTALLLWVLAHPQVILAIGGFALGVLVVRIPADRRLLTLIRLGAHGRSGSGRIRRRRSRG